MLESLLAPTNTFVDRRGQATGNAPTGGERRQFASNYDSLSPDARELAQAVDAYKMQHRRRFITYEEILHVVKLIGYSR